MKHYLIVAANGDDIDVEHPDDPRCVEVISSHRYGTPLVERPECPVEFELNEMGFDSLETQFDTWPPPDGRYPFEFWSERIVIPMVGTEYDGGLRRL